MKITAIALIGVIISALAITPVHAGKSARSGSKDPRVKTFTYSENEVYKIKGHYGFSSVLEFSSKERVETISIGDSEAWQIVKPNRPNILFIKPLEQNAETNMTVLTNKHIYTFELSAGKAASHHSSDLSFRLKFIYPGETDIKLANIGSMSSGSNYTPFSAVPAADWNFDYSYSGSKRLRPEKVFDDGDFTYFQFKDFDVMPAIFSVDEKGSESLVNYNIQGQYLVVTKIGRQFTLRDGKTATCIFNETYPAPETGIEKNVVSITPLKEKRFANGIPKPSKKPRKFANKGNSFFGGLFNNFEPVKTASMNN